MLSAKYKLSFDILKFLERVYKSHISPLQSNLYIFKPLLICNRFGAFEEFKKHNIDSTGNLTPAKRLLCGLGAGVSEAILAVTPMETLKVKFINDQRSPNPRFKGFFHGVSTIIKEQGDNI